MITIQNRQSVPVDVERLRRAAQLILTFLTYKDFDLAIVLVTDDAMQKFNKTYRDKDKPTDVLSFPFFPELKAGERIVPTCRDEKNLGDLIMAPQYIQDTLGQWDDTFEHRMLVLLVHGVCHLLGYDHLEDEEYERMKQEEERILNHVESKLQ